MSADSIARVSQDAAFRERFELGPQLGAGGMGAVYRATQRALDRAVAIKFLAAELAREPGYVQRFLAEARLAAKLAAPNVVTVFDCGTAAEVPYLVSELVAGRTLADLLKERGTLSVAETLTIARGVLAGLAAIHGLGIVHRDIKPANIIVAGDAAPVAKILDFGIAKLTGGAANPDAPRTATGMVVGTPEFMAPEQAAGDPLSPATDLYAFSLILYRMAVGRPAFVADTALDLLRMQIQAEPEFPEALVPAFREVLARGLAKRPSERVQSAAELASLLDRAAPAVEAAGGFLRGAAGTRVAPAVVPASAIPTERSPAVRAVEGVTHPSQPAPVASSGISKIVVVAAVVAAVAALGLRSAAIPPPSAWNHTWQPPFVPVPPRADDELPDLNLKLRNLIYDQDRLKDFSNPEQFGMRQAAERPGGALSTEFNLGHAFNTYWLEEGSFEKLENYRLRSTGVQSGMIWGAVFGMKNAGALEVEYTEAKPIGGLTLELESARADGTAVFYRLRLDLAHPGWELLATAPEDVKATESQRGPDWRRFQVASIAWRLIARHESPALVPGAKASLEAAGDALTVRIGDGPVQRIPLGDALALKDGQVYARVLLEPRTALVLEHVRITGDIGRAH